MTVVFVPCKCKKETQTYFSVSMKEMSPNAKEILFAMNTV